MSLVAVASRSFSNHPVLRNELVQRYPEVRFNETGRTLAGEELVEFLQGAEKAILGLEVVTRDILKNLPDLKVIGKYGVGLDKIDFQALSERGVRVGWTAGVNRRSVAELALAFMLSTIRQIHSLASETRAGAWQIRPGYQLTGKTVGLIGCGHIGKDLVQLLEPFKCRVLVHDLLMFPDFYARYGITPTSLDHLLAESDIVSLHVPLDSSTRNLLSREKLSKMKRGSILVNTARGGLVDEDGLKQVLVEGHLAAAAFDVFSTEPPRDLDLIQLPSFLTTPHIGGGSHEAILAMGRAAIEGLDQHFSAEHFLAEVK